MLTVYLMPTDEELFKKYNPELQQRSLERREERLAEFDEWLTNLKRQSKINKPSTFPFPARYTNMLLTKQSGLSKKKRPRLPAKPSLKTNGVLLPSSKPSAKPCAKRLPSSQVRTPHKPATRTGIRS